MTKARQAVGAYGERLAVRYLVEAGLVPVARNWRCSDGEIDIVLWDGEELVFCEVKTRRTATFGSPAAAVLGAKSHRLRRLAARWLAAHPVHPRDIRFDVVEVLAQPRGAARVAHLKAAF